MFRDDDQKRRALCALIGAAPPLVTYWTDEGPSAEALAVVHGRDDAGLSLSDRVLLAAACALQDPSTGGPGLALLLRLDLDAWRALSGLLSALHAGPTGIDAWAHVQARTNRERPGLSGQAPPALVGAIVLDVVRRLAPLPGARVSLDAVRKELATLSDDAAALALLEAERIGAVALEVDDAAQPGAFCVAPPGRGVIGWVREAPSS